MPGFRRRSLEPCRRARMERTRGRRTVGRRTAPGRPGRRWKPITVSCCGWCRFWNAFREARSSSWETGCRARPWTCWKAWSRPHIRAAGQATWHARTSVSKNCVSCAVWPGTWAISTGAATNMPLGVSMTRGGGSEPGPGRIARGRGRAPFDEIVSFSALHAAALRAARGKRSKPGAAAFLANLEKEVLRLERELRSGTYRPGRYQTIEIFDPKHRIVSAAPFRDRVVHAFCAVCEPLFERGFVHDSYANRKGKGTHRAIARYETFRDRFGHVLRCDIYRYFPAIDHAILKQGPLVAHLLQRLRNDPRLQIIRSATTTATHRKHFYAPESLNRAQHCETHLLLKSQKGNPKSRHQLEGGPAAPLLQKMKEASNWSRFR